MSAELIKFGEPAVGAGGEFERECARTLRDRLPEGYVIATNVHLARGGGSFYECDVVIAAPGICDILEMKCIRPEVLVDEDIIRSSTEYCVDRVFSILDSKAKVLASRKKEPPFPSAVHHQSVRVNTLVVVPSDTRISFRLAQKSRLVKTLNEAVEKYKRIASELRDFRDVTARREIRNAWMALRDASAKGMRRTHQFLGRFAIRRQLPPEPGVYEYFAVDEPPCKMEVLLREFPIDPVLPAKMLQTYLAEVARETRILMNVRHPHVLCVVGHFQTGCSWVQVSDWFDGERLEDLWPVIAEASNSDKMGVFTKVVQALQFCHERGVFHRNLSAKAVKVTHDLSDIRLGGFDCALDLSGTSATSSVLTRRDPRLVPPEDLRTGQSPNSRLSDIFQVGVLLYRLLEKGEWPFANTLDYVTSGEKLRPFLESSPDSETEALRALALRMMDVNPSRRPELLSKVEQEVQTVLARGLTK